MSNANSNTAQHRQSNYDGQSHQANNYSSSLPSSNNDRGSAAMNPERQREIEANGGFSAHELNTNTKEEETCENPKSGAPSTLDKEARDRAENEGMNKQNKSAERQEAPGRQSPKNEA